MAKDDDVELSPGTELLWGDRRRPARGRKPALSVDLIVAEAIALADAEGLSALSMQRLAERLGKGTMSLYRYVASKDDLVAVMLDTAIGAPESTAAPSADWRSGLERWAHETRAIFRTHPWTLQLVTRRRMMGPNETARMEGALAAISGLGLTPAEMLDAALVVNGYVRGATQPDVDTPAEETDSIVPHDPTLSDVIQTLDRQQLYPTLTTVMNADPTATDNNRQADAGFEFGLRCVLDGLQAHLDNRPERTEKP